MNLERGARFGSFEIVGPLGAGAMGAVYKARDTRLDRFVAIEVLSADLSTSPEARERFEREARTISQLSHPHICAPGGIFRVAADRMSESGAIWLNADTLVFSGLTPPHLVQKDLRTNAEEQLCPPAAFQLTEDISPDGKTFMFTQRTRRGNFDIRTMPANPRGAAAPLMETSADEYGPRFSPDGRYVAFASDESGRYEVYVAALPFTGGTTRVSPAGGWLPRWSRDDRELFYIAGDLRLMAQPVRLGPPLALGAAQPLFTIKRATE